MNIKCLWKRIQIDYQNNFRCLSLKGSEVVLYKGNKCEKKKVLEDNKEILPSILGILYYSGCRLP